MLKKYAGMLIVAGLVLLSPRDADAAAVRCDACASDEEFSSRAAQRGPGLHYVFSVHRNLLQTWRVPEGVVINGSDSQAPNGLSRSASGKPVKVVNPPAATAELSKAHTLHVIGGNTLRPVFNVPHHELGLNHTLGRTVHDVVYDNNLRGQIASAAASAELLGRITSSGLIVALQDLKSVGTSLLGLRDQAGILIRVVMEDGSYIDVKVDIDETVGNVLTDTARTASGQVVPAHLSQTTGTWTYSPVDNLATMVSHFERLGATIQRMGPSGGTVSGITCTGDICIVTTVPR